MIKIVKKQDVSYKDIVKVLRRYEELLKAKLQFKLFLIVKESDKNQENIEQSMFADLVFEVINEETIKIIKSDGSMTQGVYVLQK